MKSLKLIAAGSLALSLAGVASAVTGTVVNVVGSTAFRTAVINAEIAQVSHVGANLPGGVAETAAIGAVDPHGQGISMVHGYLSDGLTEVVYRNHWTGSAAGCYDLSAGNFVSQLPLTTVPTVAGVNLATGSDTDVTSAPNTAFSDVQAADAAAALSTGLNGGNFSGPITAAALVNAGTVANKDTGVAAATFKWVLGNSAIAPANWSAQGFNLTQQQGATLISSGVINLATITANSADATTAVVMVGRNEDSGSRIDYQAESLGGGTLNNAGAFGAATSQFMLQQNGVAYPTGPSNTTGSYPTIATVPGADGITGFKLWPRLQALPANTGWTVSTIPALTWKTIGHSGYNGGGDVKAILSTQNPVTLSGHFAGGFSGLPAGTAWTAVYFVSCLGSSDAGGVTGGTILKYNGITYSDNAAEEGQYTLYTFEHCYVLPALAGTQLTIANGLADTLLGFSTAQIGAAGLDLTSFLNGLNRGQSAGGRIN
jgi:hypothetical protein